MLLIYVPKLTNRIGYTLNVLFKHLLHVEFSITTDDAVFLGHDGAKLCYGPQRLGDSIHIKSCKLLTETTIEEQEPRPFQHDGQWMLFPVYSRDLDLPFDIFAATFYLVSRYEEYLPHRQDEHGRFEASQSLAGIHGFLHLPVVDQWAEMLRELLNRRYPNLAIAPRKYHFVQTVDIDAAWCYAHKGIFRTVVGTMRDLFVRRDIVEVRRRWRVILHREEDPFDTFDYILKQHKERPGRKLIFFALVADYDQYDKPSNPQNPHTGELLQHLDDYASMGIHPGYNALEDPKTVDKETRRLENILHRTISKSRYHFLRLHLPTSYNTLLHAGLTDDYTMGYADAVGFRAGISSPYPFYNLERDMETTLIIHPFCVMDTTLQKYLKLTPEEAVESYQRLVADVRRVGGDFCCIIHNQNLSELFGWKGWRTVYERMLEIAKP
jgi:hypothetical protein